MHVIYLLRSILVSAAMLVSNDALTNCGMINNKCGDIKIRVGRKSKKK